MKRKFFTIILAFVFAFSALTFTASASPLAYTSTQTVLLDGEKVELQAYALKDENGYPTNYVKLRDVAYLLNGTPAQFEVGWDGDVLVTTGQSYTANGSELSTPFSGNRAYSIPKSTTKVDGETLPLDAILISDDNGGGYTYYKLRDLGNALGFIVDWTQETGIIIDTGANSEPVPAYIPDGSYDEEAFEENYFTLPERLSEIAPFTGEVKEMELSKNAENMLKSDKAKGITIRKLMVGDVPVYEAYKDNGEVKPMAFLLHGAGADKESNLGNLIQLANDGIYVVALDSAGSGESDLGPLMTPLALAHTVKYIDTLVEYYNTVETADAYNAIIVGGSLGGNIAYCYGAHGKYTMTAIFPCLATPDMTLMPMEVLNSAFDHGKHEGVESVWTEEQILAFAQAYSPAQHPLRFFDTYIHAGNGALDESTKLEGIEAFEEKLASLGGDKFSFYIDPDHGHERLPEYYDTLFDVINEVLFG